MKSFQRTRSERTRRIDCRSVAGGSTKAFASPSRISGPGVPQWCHTCSAVDQESAGRKQNGSE